MRLPELLFEQVPLGEGGALGTVGGGLELAKDWFVETRLVDRVDQAA